MNCDARDLSVVSYLIQETIKKNMFSNVWTLLKVLEIPRLKTEEPCSASFDGNSSFHDLVFLKRTNQFRLRREDLEYSTNPVLGARPQGHFVKIGHCLYHNLDLFAIHPFHLGRKAVCSRHDIRWIFIIISLYWTVVSKLVVLLAATLGVMKSSILSVTGSVLIAA